MCDCTQPLEVSALLNVSPLAAFTITDDLTVTGWNAAAEQLFGWTAGELLGRPLPIVPPGLEAECAHLRRTALAEGTAFGFEVERVRKDGVRVLVSVALAPLRGGSGRPGGFVGFVQDMRRQKQAEEALRESEERHRLVCELTSDYAFSYRVAEDGSLKREWLAGAFVSITGYDASEWDERGGPRSLVHPEDAAAARERFAILTSGKPDTRELRIVAKDGKVRWIRMLGRPVLDPATGRVVRILGAAQDITERRAAEEALGHSEANFRTLIERSPDAVIVHKDDRILYVNPAVLGCLGYERVEELLGRSPLEIVHPADRDAVRRRIAEAPAGGVNPAHEERLLRKDGSEAIVEAVGLRIAFDGKPAVMAILRDITERKQMQTRLAMADRMVSLGTLAAGVAHEINNPLTFVIANLGFAADALDGLGRSGAPPAAVPAIADLRDAIREATQGAERVRQIVRDMKTFSRVDETHSQAVDVERIVESSINMTYNEIRHRARLVKDLGPVPKVKANEGRLGQVVLNLLTNAAQAIPEGDAEHNEIRVAARTEAEHVVIEVQDSGSGIAPEILSRIFDPFFTTKAPGVGTGLGLSICHAIVASMGGDIGVESTVGKGSVFRVRLPAARSSHAGAQPVAAAAKPDRSARVLVIDDEQVICATARRILSAHHEVETFTSAPEALERLQRDPPVDLILCDLMMPVMTGMAFYDELRTRCPDYAARVVFMTGGAFTSSAREFLDRIPNPAVDKPFDVRGLRETVRRALG